MDEDEFTQDLAEDAPQEPEAPAEPTPSEQPWSPSADEWGQMRQWMGAAGPILEQVAGFMQQQQQYGQPQQAGYYQPQPEPEIEIDPFDPDSIRSYIEASIQRGVAERIGQYEPMLMSVATREGEQLARRQLEDLKTRVGSFDQDAAFLIASGMIEQGNDPSDALRFAAQWSSDFEKRVREDERARYKQELAQLQQAPREQSGSAVAVEMEKVPTGPRRYEEAIARAMARRNPEMPVG